MSVWAEIAKAIPSVITAGTAVYGVTIAKAGLDKWKRETIGKRKAELAEEVLADFYQAREVIQSARSPMAFAHEGATRQKADDETKDETSALNSYFAIIERLQAKNEFFAQLHARQYRFLALFGSGADKSHKALIQVYNEMVIAARGLIRTCRQAYKEDRVGPVDEESERRAIARRKRMEQKEAIIWWGAEEEDPILKRLDDVVRDIEALCRPAIQEVVPR